MFAETCNHRLPQNSHTPRLDFPVPLDLSEISRIQKLIFGQPDDTRFQRTFQAAAKFYLRALQTVERDPEVAYLSLITVGEIVANWHQYEPTALLDADVSNDLELIRNFCPDGARVADRISGRLRQVRRKFIKCFCSLCDDDFFARSERAEDFRLSAQSFQNLLGAAYDLRSKYLHTGKPFGICISPDYSPYETQPGRPSTGDSEFDKIVAKAPTYLGLERLTRYALLRFAQRNGTYVDPQNDGSIDSGRSST